MWHQMLFPVLETGWLRLTQTAVTVAEIHPFPLLARDWDNPLRDWYLCAIVHKVYSEEQII